MKFVILVCSLVVLFACNEVQCVTGRPNVTGECKLEDLSESDRTSCHGIHCVKNEEGEIFTFEQTCEEQRCFDTAPKSIEHDITKVFPGCCPRITCE